MDKERLAVIIDNKVENLPKGVNLIGPEDEMDFDTQADWLVLLLSKMYTEHGITKNRDQLVEDICRKKCELWFAVKDGQPIGSAALIQQADGSVEVGRAVALENGVGGLLMLMAVASHLKYANGPVVGEVRMADCFADVPSGEATQIICFRHLGLEPHALVPAFNHGVPRRQEMFMFSSSDKITENKPAFFPYGQKVLNVLTTTAIAFVGSTFREGLEIRFGQERRLNSGWNLVGEAPFCVVVPDTSGVSLDVVVNEAEKKAPFTLIPLGLKKENSTVMVECFEKGFVPCGFDRNLDDEGWPVLLLGKLRRDTLLAPIKIVDGLLDEGVMIGAHQIDQRFRNELR